MKVFQAWARKPSVRGPTPKSTRDTSKAPAPRCWRMSFFLTKEQILDPSDDAKDLTRRLGFEKVRPGDTIIAVEKCQGMRRGEKQVVLNTLRVKSVRRERLNAITADDCRREGFPHLSTGAFVQFFCKANQCEPSAMVTRLEFKRVKSR